MEYRQVYQRDSWQKITVSASAHIKMASTRVHKKCSDEKQAQEYGHHVNQRVLQLQTMR